jgi:hypothetical protein
MRALALSLLALLVYFLSDDATPLSRVPVAPPAAAMALDRAGMSDTL